MCKRYASKQEKGPPNEKPTPKQGAFHCKHCQINHQIRQPRLRDASNASRSAGLPDKMARAGFIRKEGGGVPHGTPGREGLERGKLLLAKRNKLAVLNY